MKILILGAAGQLGRDIQLQLGEAHELLTPDHNDLAVEIQKSVEAYLNANKPDAIVNCAAYHDVELCEENPETSFLINSIAPLNIQKCAEKIQCSRVIFISTDYVFNGKKGQPYIETDLADPVNTYGLSKAAGEMATCRSKNAIVLRVGGLYGEHPCRAKGGRNFVSLMRSLAETRDTLRVVDDEIVTPTCTRDLARQIEVMLTNDVPGGIYHATSQGECSWNKFAREIFDILDMDIDVQIADPGEFPSKTPRPSYSVLENKSLKSQGLDVMPHWREGLAAHLKDR